MLAMTLPGRLGHGVMYMPSHVGDDVARVTWPWRDVYAESCSYRLDHCSYGLGPKEIQKFFVTMLCLRPMFAPSWCSFPLKT
jgi:hypothetical protein